jgi:hypothetical protein
LADANQAREEELIPHAGSKATEAAAPEATEAATTTPHSGHADARLRGDVRGWDEF